MSTIIWGLSLPIIEIFDPAFFFLALGIAALITGLLSLFYIVGSNVLIYKLLYSLFLALSVFFLPEKLEKNSSNFLQLKPILMLLKGKQVLSPKLFLRMEKVM